MPDQADILPTSSHPTKDRPICGRRRIGVEEFLAWSYRIELPKVRRGGSARTVASMPDAWGSIESYGELLTIVDVSPNLHGCIPDVWSEDELTPHADALVAAGAVADLAQSTMAWEEGLDVLGDLVDLTQAERIDCNRRGYDIARARGDQLAALVMRRAMIGGAPDWTDHGPVERRVVCGPKGRPVWFRMAAVSAGEGMPDRLIEVDGFDPKSRVPFADAYRKTYLDPDPARLAAERIDYQAWVMALDLIAINLRSAGLASHVVLAPNRPFFPWDGEVAPRREPRVLLMPETAGARKNSRKRRAPA